MQEYEVQGFPTVYLLNPKTKEKEHIDNAKLFEEDAVKKLSKEFMEFVKEAETEKE